MTNHDRLLKSWKECAFGVKTRVYKVHLQQTIDYILKNPNYQDEEKILAIIDCIEEKSKEVLEEASQMVENISNINK